jgi:hypothetical protein
MTSNTILYAFVFFIFILEIFSFFIFYNMIQRGSKNRNREFEKLDYERAQLIQLQSSVASDLKNAKSLSHDTLQKIGQMASQVEAHWHENSHKLEGLFQELSQTSALRVADDMSRIQKTKLAVDRTIQESKECLQALTQVTVESKRLLKAIDGSIPTEEILKEIQSEKFTLAKNLLHTGLDASSVAKKVGLTLSEVNLLSFSK